MTRSIYLLHSGIPCLLIFAYERHWATIATAYRGTLERSQAEPSPQPSTHHDKEINLSQRTTAAVVFALASVTASPVAWRRTTVAAGGALSVCGAKKPRGRARGIVQHTRPCKRGIHKHARGSTRAHARSAPTARTRHTAHGARRNLVATAHAHLTRTRTRRARAHNKRTNHSVRTHTARTHTHTHTHAPCQL